MKDICEKFCAVLEKHCKYVVISGYVVIASGRPRGTVDIDVLIERMDRKRFTELNNDLMSAGFECMYTDSADDIYDGYIENNTSVRYMALNRPLPEMELIMAKDKLDELTLATRKKIPSTEHDVWMSDINVNIAFKEEYLGSDKDMEDARHLRLVYKDIVNEEEINRIKNMIKKERMS